MSTLRLFVLSQKNILLIFLFLLLAGRSIFRMDSEFFSVILSTFFATLVFIKVLRFILKRHIDLKNSFIISSIILLLVGPVSMDRDFSIFLVLIFLTFLFREVLRYKLSPLINPAVIGGGLIIIAGYIIESGLFIGWSGMNYTIKAFGYTLAYATWISVLACIALVISSKKYWYALGFFASYAALGYAVLGKDFMEYSLLDGTLYFFFGVMALEPKTGVNGKSQIYYGVALGVLLVTLLEYHIPGDYLLALCVINLIFFIHRVLRGKHTTKVHIPGQKWICVPCGYIYDPLLGDLDSGIKPGTEFIDIPDSWKCPECGVTKADFIPYEEGEESTQKAKIIQKTFLNPSTLELVIESVSDLTSLPGQYVGFLWKDDAGEFSRSYSIVKQEGRRFTFTIKLSEFGRGALILRNIRENTSIKIRGVFGKFTLQDTPNPKIFVATGTGLAPIFNMLQVLEKSEENITSTLYFSVAKKDDLFYQDKLAELRKTKIFIYTTREEVEGCIFARINIDTIEASPDTEWYLCGNPKMVQEAEEKLDKRGFAKVYSEEFGF